MVEDEVAVRCDGSDLCVYRRGEAEEQEREGSVSGPGRAGAEWLRRGTATPQESCAEVYIGSWLGRGEKRRVVVHSFDLLLEREVRRQPVGRVH